MFVVIIMMIMIGRNMLEMATAMSGSSVLGGSGRKRKR